MWVNGLRKYIQGHDILNKNYGIEVQEDLSLNFTKIPDAFIRKDLFLIYLTYHSKREHAGTFSHDYSHLPFGQANAIWERSEKKLIKLHSSSRNRPLAGFPISLKKPRFNKYEKKLKFNVTESKDIDEEFLEKFRQYVLQIFYNNQSIKHFMLTTPKDETNKAFSEHDFKAFFWQNSDIKRSILTSVFSEKLDIEVQILSLKNKLWFKTWVNAEKDQNNFNELAKKLFINASS